MSSQEQDFAEIIRLLKQISEKLDKPCSCGPKDGAQSSPFPLVGPSPCPVCYTQGINGYACPRADCPTAIRSNPIWNAVSNGTISVANGTPFSLTSSNDSVVTGNFSSDTIFVTGLTVVSNT